MGFVAMNPSRHADAHRDFYNHLVEGDGESAEAHRRFYDEYNAVLDMPAEYYLDTIKTVFQEFSLPKGRMFVREQLVRPQAISKTALLTIEGELDDISGNGQTEAAHALCTAIPAKQARALSRARRWGITAYSAAGASANRCTRASAISSAVTARTVAIPPAAADGVRARS